MARPPRLHVPDGLYYIVLRGNGGQAIFQDDADYEEFSRLVAKSLRRNRCRVHAFCWLENSAIMALQISDVRVGRFVQHVTGQYAKYSHGKLNRSGHLFEHHHRALLVQRSRYLLDLVRHVHLAPVRIGLVNDPGDYPWSGQRAYLEEERIAWLTTYVAQEMLDHAAHPGRLSYRAWMERAEDPDIARLLESGSKRESRAAGDDAFISRVTGRIEPPRPDRSLDEIIETTVRGQGVSLKSVLSPSRRRRHVLTRALIAWQATQGGVATLAEVATRLNRDPSTLWTAVERYRAARPELFLEPDPATHPEAIGGGAGELGG